MNRNPQTIRLSPKAYGIDWWRIVRLVGLAAVVAAALAVKYGA